MQKTSLHVRMAVCATAALFLGLAYGQDTHGQIFGHVLDPSGTPVTKARVVVTNTETNASLPFETNDTGYYEAPLLISGSYRVTAESTGFKKAVHEDIALRIGARAQVDFRLDIGSVSESVTVDSGAPLLDTTTATAGRILENRDIEDLPYPSANVSLVTRLAPGVQTTAPMNQYGSGTLHANGASSSYNLPGSVGGNEWSLDGTVDAGNARQMAYIPASETIEEMKIETSNFDASMGHSTGINIVAMSKAGTNLLHGSGRETYWSNRWQAMNFFQKQTYYRNIDSALASGNTTLVDSLRNTPGQPGLHENDYGFVLGGPVVIPKVVNGRDKLFFFASYNGYQSATNALQNQTVPTTAELGGNFADTLKLGSQYQIYDPLSVQLDPAHPGHYVRTPFAGNVIPLSRIGDSAVYNAYKAILPVPNNLTSTLTNDFQYQLIQPQIYKAYSSRMDYNLSERDRFYFRWNYSRWDQTNTDWETNMLGYYPNHRTDLGGSLNWVHTLTSNTVLTATLAANDYQNWAVAEVALSLKPSNFGFPAYMDQKAGSLTEAPQMTWSGYSASGNNRQISRIPHYDTQDGKLDVMHVRGAHSLRAGFELRLQKQTNGSYGYPSGNFAFGNKWTAHDDYGGVAAGGLGFSWAEMLLGLPETMSTDTNADWAESNPYYGGYVQETWRITPKLTLNLGLRMEYEIGIRERWNRALTGFDPAAALPIAAAAQAAYAAAPNALLPAGQFKVQGGTLYAGVGGSSSRLWGNVMDLMPRFGMAYQLPRGTVVRVGYGMYYDTLNAVNQGAPNQLGFSRTTSTTLSNDSGMTWNAGNPYAGVSPMADPFPVRADGTRYDLPLGSALGLMSEAGSGYNFTDPNLKHARSQRWHAGLQHQFGKSIVLEAAYDGSYADHIQVSQTLNPLPSQYWSFDQTRNNTVAANMTQNVANPFAIGNFADLKNSNPVLYNNMAVNSFFSSSTIQLNRLLRAYPQFSGTLSENLPIGKSVFHQFNLALQKRFSRGFNLNVAYSKTTERDATSFLNEFNGEPFWGASNGSRPTRLTGTGIYEIPFGKGRPFLQHGLPSKIFGGFQIGLIYEYQPGALVNFGTSFYLQPGMTLADVNTAVPTIGHWINTAAFVTSAAAAPASYQARVYPAIWNGGPRQDPNNLWQANLVRNFKVWEHATMQFRFDALDLFNRSQFNGPDTNPTSATFGQVTSNPTQTNRFLTISAKLQF